VSQFLLKRFIQEFMSVLAQKRQTTWPSESFSPSTLLVLITRLMAAKGDGCIFLFLPFRSVLLELTISGFVRQSYHFHAVTG